jgi:hypothetical protein
VPAPEGGKFSSFKRSADHSQGARTTLLLCGVK